jgi:hypothetical protein
MTEKTSPEIYGHRLEQFIEMSDIPFVEEACKILGGIEFGKPIKEGRVYATYGGQPILVPQGKAWIKLRAQMPAGQGFDFVFRKAEKLKEQSQKT